jgi:type IV pilus assembly protein PilA
MQPSSHGFAGREILLILGVIAVVLSALGYAAFQKVRQSSQDKAVMCPIRQLAAAADQYYLENNVTVVDYAQLVGATNYVKAVYSIAGETYPTRYIQGMTITVTGVAGLRTITYAP